MSQSGAPAFWVRLVAALALALSLQMVACGGEAEPRGEGPLRVMASNSIVADWVRQVGGDELRVDILVPSGADAHTFQMTPSDVRAVAAADLVFLVGAGLERSFERAVRENADAPVVELSEGLALRRPAGGDSADADHGGVDPHIWMDADLAVAAVERIVRELGAVSPDDRSTFESNGAAYVAAIRRMDAEIAARLAGLSAAQKLLVTFHDAYGYFAARYGLKVLGFVVENVDEEPSAARIADLVRVMREEGAKTVYIEPQFSSRVVEQVARETGAEVRTIPSDSLVDAFPSYIEMMEAIANGIIG